MKVEKNISIPPSGKSKYPIFSMKIGESFFVEGKIVSQIWGAIVPTAKRNGIEVTMRSVVEKKKSGVRIWRTK